LLTVFVSLLKNSRIIFIACDAQHQYVINRYTLHWSRLTIV